MNRLFIKILCDGWGAGDCHVGFHESTNYSYNEQINLL